MPERQVQLARLRGPGDEVRLVRLAYEADRQSEVKAGHRAPSLNAWLWALIMQALTEDAQ